MTKKKWAAVVGVLATICLVTVGAAVTMGAAATEPSATLVGAGDIASSGKMDTATAKLVEARPGARVFTLGDNAYNSGTAAEFSRHYAPTWGAFKSRTWPSTGNHDYLTANAQGYKNYFGALAQPNGKPYYKKTPGGWSVYVMDWLANKKGTAQYAWLQQNLQAEPDSGCAVMLLHAPPISSGEHGGIARSNDVFSLFDAEGGDLVLAGHDHDYERFAPMSIEGGVAKPSSSGVPLVIVGTGGGSLRPFEVIKDGSVVRQAHTHGVLKLTLEPTGYSARFVPVAGKTWTDSFSGACSA